MVDLLLIDELADPSATPRTPAVAASASGQTHSSLMDSDPHDSSAWAQPFAQWNSIMSSAPTEQPAVRHCFRLNSTERCLHNAIPSAWSSCWLSVTSGHELSPPYRFHLLPQDSSAAADLDILHNTPVPAPARKDAHTAVATVRGLQPHGHGSSAI